MSNIKSPIKKWDYQSLYAIASDPKANKTIAHNTIVSLARDENNFICVDVFLHGNSIARIQRVDEIDTNYVWLLDGAYDWVTYTTCTRLSKLMVDNKQDGIGRCKGE